ncbi:uncharacterized protein LOC129601498 [Paramacrobiotus metropolitanus]|uniref:uncharacterized protein LOC129601498 n=1 Tax=Paramacrobiotus metropolitanus TaxID=2943436 RepID=UPI00244570C5|nr:uncharacterized protein LOC129601498 [Paramacrobiotus metropolitanus]
MAGRSRELTGDKQDEGFDQDEEIAKKAPGGETERAAAVARKLHEIGEKQSGFIHSSTATDAGSPLLPTSAGNLMATIAPATPTSEAEDAEQVTEFDWVPSDQRRHTMYPPECPACTGNCPCPPFKRKRKHAV